MADTIHSVWDSLQYLSVEEMLADPTLLSTAFGEKIDEFAAFDALFDVRNVAGDVVAYRHATAAYLEDEPEFVAEGGEIPVSDPVLSSQKLYADIRKQGIGLRVSWEQIVDDKRDAVADELLAKANSVTRKKKREALAALKDAPVHELAVTTPWDADGDVKGDLMDAMGLILGAVDENGDPFSYEPKTVWANPLTVMDIQRSKSMDELFNGDMRSEHPLFAGAGQLTSLLGDSLIVLKDYAVPRGELWMASTQKPGKLAQREDEYTSPFYAEDGGAVDLRLGKRQTARSNYSHRRAFYVDHPKSVVHITGLASA